MAGPSNESKEQTITLLHIASYSKVTKVNSWSLIGFVQLLNKSNHDSWPVDMVFIKSSGKLRFLKEKVDQGNRHGVGQTERISLGVKLTWNKMSIEIGFLDNVYMFQSQV